MSRVMLIVDFCVQPFIIDSVPAMLDAIFEPTLDMINKVCVSMLLHCELLLTVTCRISLSTQNIEPASSASCEQSTRTASLLYLN